MTARDLPNGTGNPCPFHTTTLAAFKAANTHEEEADSDRRDRHVTGQCCDHPRATRDGHPTTEENQP